MKHSSNRIFKNAFLKLRGALSFILAFALILSCMGGVFSLSTSAATTYPTYMIKVSDQNGQCQWSQFGLELGSLQAGSTYQLKYMVNTNTFGTQGYTRISNARNGYSNDVTFVSDNYDTNSRVRTVEFSVTTAGTYYLRYVQPQSSTPLYFSGLELYNLTTDSGKTNNMLDYNCTDVKGWASNWYTGTAGMLTFTNDKVTVTRMGFNADVFGIVVVEEDTTPKMVKSTSTTWNWFGFSTTVIPGHSYQYSYSISHEMVSYIASSASSGADISGINKVANFDDAAKVMTITFDVPTSAASNIYFMYQQTTSDAVYIADFELYDLTADSGKITNLLDKTMEKRLYGWRSNWGDPAAEGATSYNWSNGKVALATVNYDTTLLGINTNPDLDLSKQMLKIDLGASIQYAEYSHSANLILGHTYRYSFNLTDAYPDGNQYAAISFAIRLGANVIPVISVSDDEIQKYTYEFTIPTDSSSVTPQFIFTNQATSGVHYIGDIKLVDITDETATNLLSNIDFNNGLYQWTFRGTLIRNKKTSTHTNSGASLMNYDESVFAREAADEKMAHITSKSWYSLGQKKALAVGHTYTFGLDILSETAEMQARIMYTKDGGAGVYVNIPTTITTDSEEFGYLYTFTVPVDAAASFGRTNVIIEVIEGGTEGKNGYVTNFSLVDNADVASVNLITNPNFKRGLLGWLSNNGSAQTTHYSEAATGVYGDVEIVALDDTKFAKTTVSGNANLIATDYANEVVVALNTDFVAGRIKASIGFDNEKYTFVGVKLADDIIAANTVLDFYSVYDSSITVSVDAPADGYQGDWVYVCFEKVEANSPVSGFTVNVSAVNDAYLHICSGYTSKSAFLHDANGDGYFNIIDLVRLKKYIAHIEGTEVVVDNLVGDDAVALTSMRTALLTAKKSFFESKRPAVDLSGVMNEKGGADEAAEALKLEILNASDDIAVEGDTYYVSANGDVNNTGESEDDAITVNAIAGLDLAEGDAVLFERGYEYRLNEAITLVDGVTYAAYGEGAKPALYGSVKNYATFGTWKLASGNIWKTNLEGNIGNIVFNYGQATGTMRDEFGKCVSNGDFWHDTSKNILYLYCDLGCPEDYYTNIEIATTGSLLFATDAQNIVIDNLTLKYAAVHTISISNSSNITVTNCEIGYGGGARSTSGSDRLGNGIQIWADCSDITVENCYVYQQFDAGITFQCDVAATIDNIAIRNNLVEYCTYSIEYFVGDNEDSAVSNIDISGNILRFAGYGFGMKRQNAVGTSHLTGWDYTITNTSNFSIQNNIFDCSAQNLVCWFWEDGTTQPGLNIFGNSFYQKAYDIASSNVADKDTLVENAAMNFGAGKTYATAITAINTTELSSAVSVFDSNPSNVAYIAE